MPISAQSRQRRLLLLLIAAAAATGASLVAAHVGEHSLSCPFSSSADEHQHRHHRPREHHHGDHHAEIPRARLPEELAEEEDLMLNGFDHYHQHHHDGHGDHHECGHHHHEHEIDQSKIGIWVRAMGCSLLVSLASLVCLIMLPVIFLQGKPSKAVVDSLAVFGAGAMLGDAFLHQLPHAFGGGHVHSHHHHDHLEENGEHSHAHTLQDLSVGLSVLFGIILFLMVEKVVRYVEENSGRGVHGLGHGHHHHHQKKLKNESENSEESFTHAVDTKTRDNTLDTTVEEKSLNDESGANGAEGDQLQHGSHLRQRVNATNGDIKNSNAENGSEVKKSLSTELIPSPSQTSLVFGYLNLFSDGVHNFTDGMALGSAFLLHGSVGGWSRTLFLLAHEIPQEVGDFGILVRSGFTVTKALFFNFLSALVALAGTALALVLGKDPGHSSLIEGFTAGGFIYIAVAGVLPELNSGKTTLKSSISHISALILGMTVALCISLFE